MITGGALTLASYLVVSVAWYGIAAWLASYLAWQDGSWVWVYFVWIYGAMTAIPAVIVGTATAALIGRAMRARASFPMHLLVHGAHAYVIGAMATVLCLLVMGGGPDWQAWLLYPLLWGGPAAAIAVLIGWRSTVAIARHRDAKRAVTPQVVGSTPS